MASLVVDRYGWFRLSKREIAILRFDGVALLLAGVAMEPLSVESPARDTDRQ